MILRKVKLKIAKKRKQLKNYLLSLLLRGDNVHCNICDRGYSTFITHMNRINSGCPYCGSIERTRLLWYYLNHKQLLEGTTNLLHVAPEKKLYKLFDKDASINYFPIDKFTKGYRYPAKTVDMDVTSLQFTDEQMDGIICIHVLEHVLDDRKALQEFYRVLKPKGWAIVLVPYERDRKNTYEDETIVSVEGRFKHFGQTDHVRIYGTDFKERFQAVGFSMEDWDFQHKISEEERKKFVFKGAEIFLLRK